MNKGKRNPRASEVIVKRMRERIGYESLCKRIRRKWMYIWRFDNTVDELELLFPPDMRDIHNELHQMVLCFIYIK